MGRMRLRDLLPRTRVDAIAMVFTIVMIPVAYLHGVFNVAPIIWPTQDVPDQLKEANVFPYYASVLFMTFLLVNAVANYTLTMITNTSCGRIPLPVVSQPGWRFCPYCQYYTPPRAHHCVICRTCILRRDHHCYFAGKCIGHYNQRYFVAFLLYVTVAALLGIVLSFWAVSILMGGFSWAVFPALIFPVLAWILQIMPISPLMMIETSVAMFAFMGSGGLLCLQLMEILRGQTFWEFKRTVNRYNHGFTANIADALGKNWWFCWLLPIIPSPLPGDGSHYPPREVDGHVTAQLQSHDNHVQSAAQEGHRKMVKTL